jgi:histone H3
MGHQMNSRGFLPRLIWEQTAHRYRPGTITLQIIRSTPMAIRMLPANPPVGGVIKPQPYRQGVVALREIRRYQKSTDLLIRRKPFHRLISEVLQANSNKFRTAKGAKEALQEAAEAHIVNLFKKAQKLAIHRGKSTVESKDLKLAQTI